MLKEKVVLTGINRLTSRIIIKLKIVALYKEDILV